MEYPLSDIVGGTPYATDLDEDVVVRHEIASKSPYVLCERSAEHERLTRDYTLN
jgi:hypothetical protein